MTIHTHVKDLTATPVACVRIFQGAPAGTPLLEEEVTAETVALIRDQLTELNAIIEFPHGRKTVLVPVRAIGAVVIEWLP